MLGPLGHLSPILNHFGPFGESWTWIWPIFAGPGPGFGPFWAFGGILVLDSAHFGPFGEAMGLDLVNLGPFGKVPDLDLVHFGPFGGY